MVDVAFAPWAVRLWVFDHFKEGGLGLPEKGKGGKDEEAWERWRVWAEAVAERESVKGTLSEREHYLPLVSCDFPADPINNLLAGDVLTFSQYQRYADDTAQSEMAKASRLGRSVP